MTVHTCGKGTLAEIWVTGIAAAPMRRLSVGRLLPGQGVERDRSAVGGGTLARYPGSEKQVTLIDRHQVAAVPEEAGTGHPPGGTRRNLVAVGIDLPGLIGRWFSVGDALLLGMMRCPLCTHLERLTGMRLVEALAHRRGINAAVFEGVSIVEGALVRWLADEEAGPQGALPGVDRSPPRRVT